MTGRHNACLEIFKALSDGTRLAIIEKLTMKELCACELQEALELGIAQSSLSYHMKKLTEAGLISTTREGKWIRYSMDVDKFKQLQIFLGALILQYNSAESEANNKCKYYNQCGISFKGKSLE